MFDRDPIMDSENKCDICEMWAHCTTKKKGEQFCFEPNGEDGRRAYARAMGIPWEPEPKK